MTLALNIENWAGFGVDEIGNHTTYKRRRFLCQYKRQTPILEVIFSHKVDRSQSLFYFVPQVILTVKLARLT